MSNRRLCAYYEQAAYRLVGQRTFRMAGDQIFPRVDRMVDTALYEKALPQ